MAKDGLGVYYKMKYLPKIKQYLESYYSSRGVGKSVKDRLAHFNSLYKVVYSAEVSDKIKLLLFEEELLEPEFGRDIYAN